MNRLFLTSNGLNGKTMDLFWKAIGKEAADTRAILVPSAAVESDAAREGIAVCAERLLHMGIPFHNILLYHLGFLLSHGYARTYSSYIQEIPMPFRLMNAQEIMQYDMIVFCGGNARTLLQEINRTGFAGPLKQAVANGLVYLGISAGSMIAAGNFADGLGFLPNPLVPHAATGSPDGRVSSKELIALADGQAVCIQGEQVEIVG